MRVLALLIGLVAAACPGVAHEFWIEPHEYQVKSGAGVVADLLVGENFEGAPQVFFPDRATRSEVIRDGNVLPYQGRMGDVPAIQVAEPGAGLLILVHETRATTLKYKAWEDFAAFAAHKDFPDIEARHDERGLPRQDFFESYTRHAKVLIGVGGAEGEDRETGMETEFVALANPYTDDLSDGMPVRLLYQGRPRAGAQVEVFDRAPDKTVSVFLARTDAAGEAIVPVQPGHAYMFDAVVLRPAPEGGRPVWHSLWAALTFAVPAD
ncbi:Uncharacterized conserved protein, contains GH25 family domain [Ruegeria marina]|uniref:Uncharacterized conserved protein, contains GH25 family domain n=1 Tax=Ruegeria marina TaxID=639004 RepID=A0A1G6II91_9RHOB|nr:Uncharacterized conserved protein, contains GH25 family domain [Ruegeria marina]